MAAIDSNLVMSSPNSSAIESSSGSPNAKSTPAPTPTYATFTPAPSSLPQHTSPLLSSTPPAVTKALSQAYPLILSIDYVLGLLTWTGDDIYQSILIIVAWTTIVLYFEIIVKYFGHLLIVGLIASYVWLNKEVEKHQVEHPTLDSIIHTLNNVVTRVDLFFHPLTSLNLSQHDITKLIFTTLFMTPLYIIITLFIITPRTLLYLFGIFVLTYHSVWARVTRAILWRSRTIRLISFYMTGLDFSGQPKVYGSEAQAQLAMASNEIKSTDSSKPVRFTYVIYENQRRWLGIGWTSNLLAYERASWSDEFLNECSPPDRFKLPDAEGTGMSWRWVDSNWRLDLTNDSALVVNSSKTSKVDPSPNEGFIYYDNVWKKPSAEDSYSKYTRRRRWIRTAELITPGQPHKSTESPSEDSSPKPEIKQRKKSIRFEE